MASLISVLPRRALETVMTETFRSRAMSLSRIANSIPPTEHSGSTPDAIPFALLSIHQRDSATVTLTKTTSRLRRVSSIATHKV